MKTDLVPGVLFFVIGALFNAGSYFYQIGSASSMGPGYFPLILSYLLMVLGVLLIVRSKFWNS
jgi:hypothetical protein